MMPERIDPEQRLLPSILDRLLDHDPAVTQEPAKNRAQLLRELKASVRRDIENLLNTRQWSGIVPPELTELEVSLVQYGLPDLAGMNLGANAARTEFRRTIESVLRKFEPRFKTVTVTLENQNELERTLRFRVHALLHADPVPEPITFDTSLDPSTRTFAVAGE